MSIVKRYDRGELKKPTLLPNGWLKVDGYVGRTGLLEYTQADGSVWTEYRPPEEAFDAAVLDSFDSVPLTNDHPPGGLLDATNTKTYQAGTVGRPAQDGKFARASILVTDAAAIAAIQAGKAELSMGYCCELDMTPGVHEGKRYDCVQRKISGNHVALVDHARGGPEIRLRVDGKDSDVLQSKQLPGHKQKGTHTVIKIKVDGVEVEVSEMAAQLLAKSALAAKLATEATQAELDKSKARADAFESEVKKLKGEIAEAPAKARAAIEARFALETKARKILGAEEKLDGVADLEVMRLAAAKSGAKVDGKSAVYVEACFDIACEKAAEPSPLTPAPVPRTSPVANADGGEETLEQVQKRFASDMRNAYKGTASK